MHMVFQVTPGTEAPSEMNFYFPDHRALCLAENATHNLHNLLTLRGAEVRDARNWSRYLAEAIEMFAYESDVAFASHHWPTWGTDELIGYLTEQRDLYAISTIRRCAASTRGWWAVRSPRTFRCRLLWMPRGTPTGTTVRSATM